MDERKIGGERQEALGDVTMLLDLAISRSAAAPSWMAEPRSSSADAWKRPSRNSASSQSHAALQMVTFTRRR